MLIYACRAGAPIVGRTTSAVLGRVSANLAVVFFVKKMITADRRDEDVGQSVVVVIPDGHTHAVATEIQTGVMGDIGEMTMAVVVVERERGRLCAFGNGARPIG